ncbi:MAG: cobyric acid synthase CobQ [Bacteroidota bacterium]|nr:cobyric acid synthase CobQ [Bacteroidota bacterium]
MKQNYVKFYPVSNGDQSLISLEDDTTIMVDCNIREDSVDSTDPKFFDVKKDILNVTQRRNGIPFVDVFILTHGDCDHCRGYQKNFYQGDPKKYSDKNKVANEILIDEMWFSPMIAEEHKNDDEDAYQQEAERRLELHRKKDPNKDLPGNRIKIVGYDGNKDYSDLNHLRAIPGRVVTTFNNKEQLNFSLFIHAPFKEHLTSADKDRNSTSIVFQARFKSHPDESDFIGLFMFGGDSDHYSWNIILQKTRKYGNDDTEQALDWDVFLSPHHCSWSFFNDRPQQDNPEPKSTSLEVLDYKRNGGFVIASSKKIINDEDNPPHYEAKMEYVRKVGAFNILNTATEPSESKPEPIIFTITKSGISKEIGNITNSDEKKAAAAVLIAATGIIKKPWSW